MVKIGNTDNIKYWKGYGAIGTLTHCWWECKMVQPLWKAVGSFLTKLNILLPYDSAIMLLDLPKGVEEYVHKKTCP